MERARYVVFDDAPESRSTRWTADQMADALRLPLAGIGVRVIRKQGAGSNSPFAGFQNRGSKRRQFQVTLRKVDGIVDHIVGRSRLPVDTVPVTGLSSISD